MQASLQPFPGETHTHTDAATLCSLFYLFIFLSTHFSGRGVEGLYYLCWYCSFFTTSVGPEGEYPGQRDIRVWTRIEACMQREC